MQNEGDLTIVHQMHELSRMQHGTCLEPRIPRAPHDCVMLGLHSYSQKDTQAPRYGVACRFQQKKDNRDCPYGLTVLVMNTPVSGRYPERHFKRL